MNVLESPVVYYSGPPAARQLPSIVSPGLLRTVHKQPLPQLDLSQSLRENRHLHLCRVTGLIAGLDLLHSGNPAIRSGQHLVQFVRLLPGDRNSRCVIMVLKAA